MFNFTGGMLTGHEIERQIKKGNITITPYDPGCINPNSYNLKLHPQLLVYRRGVDRSKLLNQEYNFPEDRNLYIPLSEINFEDGIKRENEISYNEKLAPHNHSVQVHTEDGEPITKTIPIINGSAVRSLVDDLDEKLVSSNVASIELIKNLDKNVNLLNKNFTKKSMHNIDIIRALTDLPNNNSYTLPPLDMKRPNETIELEIPEEGYVLQPGVLYIGRTVERTWTDKFIPMINGRSSGGRLGISIHICAGFGDIGFDGTWTLEITVVEPVRIYPNTEIAQVCYFKPCGKIKNLYDGRYQGQTHATPTRFFLGKNKKNG